MDHEVIAQVSQLIQRFRESDHLEMEVRIGQYVSGSFVPGVEPGVLKELDQMLRKSKIFVSTEWTEEHVYHFHDNDGVEKRTTVSFCDATMSDPSCATVCKSRVAVIDVPCRTHTMRFALSEEKPSAVCARALNVTRAAIRQRSTHMLMREGAPYMRYDVTRRWVGDTKTDAESKQARHDVPRCEVEIELCEKPKLDSEHLAHSLLLKSRDLISKVEADQAPHVWC